MYSTTWCGYCVRLKRQLLEAGIPFQEIDIDQPSHEHLGERIVAKTGGFRTVPTLVVGDELLVNPTLAEVTRALAS
jgi:mycoredoxin